MIWQDLFRKTPTEPEVRQPKRRREFKSAKSNRLNFGFGTMPVPLDYDLKTALPVLTTRARWLEQNDDYVRRYLKIARNNIVGPRGIELRAQYKEGGMPYKSAIASVEGAWKDWGMKGVCEVSGRLSWVDCQNLFVNHMARDGEMLCVLQPRGAFGLQLQFVDPMSLGYRLNKTLSDDREIVLGVEIDRRFRKPLAYYITVNDSNQPDTFKFENQRYKRVPAELVLHCFRVEQVHQTRGYSPLASAIQRLKMLDGYEEAALTAARAGASRMGFYTNSGDQEFVGDDEDADGELLEDFESGTMTRLPRGYDVKSFDTGWPNVDHADYVKAVLRGIASGIGVSYNTLANDLEGVNFSSMRAGVLEDREEWKAAQQWMADCFCQPIFNVWLDRSLSLQLIRGPSGAFGSERYRQFSRVTWQGRRWDWVDPLKDMQANSEAIDYRIRSISDVIRERGQDPDEVFAELQQDFEKLKAIGLEVVKNDRDRPSNTEPANAGSE